MQRSCCGICEGNVAFALSETSRKPQGEPQGRSTMNTFQTPAPIATVVNVPAGRVQVIAADRADTQVEVRPADPSRGRDVKAAEQTTVEFADGVLRVEAPAAGNQYFGPSGSVEVTVKLPAGSRVEARAASAE